MGSARANAPLTLAEALAFAAAVVAPTWALGVLLASLYVAGPAFVVLIVRLAVHPAPVLIALMSLLGVTLLVLWVQSRWTRPEIALVACAVFAGSMWLTPVLLMGEPGTGFVIGLILVVLALAFGPLPVCFYAAMHTAGSMRIGVTDPAAPSWLRGAWAWCLARYDAIRTRKETAPHDPAVRVSKTKDRRTEQR